MKLKALVGVLTFASLWTLPARADVEREAALQAYALAMAAYTEDAVSKGQAEEEFLCGFGIENRNKSVKPIAVAPYESLAGWHISEIACAGRPTAPTADLNTRYLMSPVAGYGLSGFDFEFKGRSAHKLNAIGVAFQSRALERALRRDGMPTVPMGRDLVGTGTFQELAIGRELIPLAWKLRLAEEALQGDQNLFGDLSAAERAKITELMAFLEGAPDPDENSFSSYTERLFPAVFDSLDRLAYAHFDGPAELSAERIAQELFLSHTLDRQRADQRDFMLQSDQDKVDLVLTMVRRSDVRRAMTLLAQKNARRDLDEEPMPVAYSVFRDESGSDPIRGKVSYVPLNWGHVYEAARPADESFSQVFVQKAEAARAAASMMRAAARKLTGDQHTDAESKGVEGMAKTATGPEQVDSLPPDPRDLRLASSYAGNKFTSGVPGLGSPEAQNSLSILRKDLEGLVAGTSGKVWANESVKKLLDVISLLEEVQTTEQNGETQSKLAQTVALLTDAETALMAESEVNGKIAAAETVLRDSVATRIRQASAKIFDVRARLYDGHAELFRSQTLECSGDCDILLEPASFDGELVLSGFMFGRTSGKTARLKELSVEPTRVQGFDVLRVRFVDRDGYENSTALIQYAYVSREALAFGRPEEVNGTGATTVSRDQTVSVLTYPAIQSFSFKLKTNDATDSATQDAVIQRLGIENSRNQTRVLLRATGRNDEDVTDAFEWSVRLVDIFGATVTRPTSADQPFAWPANASR